MVYTESVRLLMLLENGTFYFHHILWAGNDFFPLMKGLPSIEHVENTDLSGNIDLIEWTQLPGRTVQSTQHTESEMHKTLSGT